MTFPSFLLGVVLSTLYGAAFHLWKGGKLARLIFYLILGWVGFWLGHLAASLLGWTFDRLGALHVGAASAMSIIFLGVGHWLSLVEIANDPEK